MQIPAIAILIIILKRFKSVNEDKKVTLKSLCILPLVILYLIYSSVVNSHSTSNIHTTIPIGEVSILGIMAILGIIIGVYRAKFSHLTLNKETGEVYLKNSIMDLIILVSLILIKIVIKLVLGFEVPSIASEVGNALLVLTVVTIFTKSVVNIIKYIKLTTIKYI